MSEGQKGFSPFNPQSTYFQPNIRHPGASSVIPAKAGIQRGRAEGTPMHLFLYESKFPN